MVARTILVSILLTAAVLAQQSTQNTLNVTFSLSGTYQVVEPGAVNLSGSGQFSHLGPVQLDGAITQTATGPTYNYCSAYFNFHATQSQSDGTVVNGIGNVVGLGLEQICYTDNFKDGFPSGAVLVFGGKIPTANGFRSVKNGYLSFTLVGIDLNWTLTGQGELNLEPAPAQTAGPGGSGYPPVVAGPGGSGYPAVVNGANAGSVLVFSGSDTNAAARPHATASPSSIQIPLPVQSVASTYSVSATCLNSAANCWIDFPASSGAIAANSTVMLNADLNPQGLSPGVYSANVAITITPANTGSSGASSPSTINLPLVAIIAPEQDMLGLSQAGLQFQTLAGSQPQSASISISNLSSRSLPISASASVRSGQNWLNVSPEAGTATASNPAITNVQVDPSGLAPGTYFGIVDISAPNAVNTPQSVDVALTVLPASNSTAPILSPVAMTFVASGSSNPAPQQIQLSTLTNQPISLAAQAITNDGAHWLAVSPSSGTATAALPFAGTVAVQAGNLSPGVYTGTVILQDTGNNNNSYSTSVQLIVPKSAPCVPTQLLPILTNLGVGSQVTAAIPFPLQVQIVDDCGLPLTAGSVVASFSSGDPAVSMLPTEDGQWSGTWMPHSAAGGGVAVTVIASSPASVFGSATATGVVSPNATAPIVSQSGIVNAAAPTTPTPVAPGGFISIFGSNLATATAAAQSLPLQTLLGDTQVLLGGHTLPLDFVSTGQINALIPYDTPVDTIQLLTVVHAGIPSPAETLVVAPAQPAVFTQDQTGDGPGVIMVVKPDGTQFLNTSSAPATAGDALVIYGAGLGVVTPAIPDGSAAPSSPLSRTTNPIAVTIGGQNAPVIFSGLAPEFVGLYQINVTVPSGVPAAADAPLVITAGNSSSPTVTLAIQ
jgi:uncharacterized protein (TIGR03437 family)